MGHKVFEWMALGLIVVLVGSWAVGEVSDMTQRIAEDTAIKMQELH